MSAIPAQPGWYAIVYDLEPSEPDGVPDHTRYPVLAWEPPGAVILGLRPLYIDDKSIRKHGYQALFGYHHPEHAPEPSPRILGEGLRDFVRRYHDQKGSA